MGKSWGLVKKELEQVWLCESLRGHIHYHVVREKLVSYLSICMDEEELHRTTDEDYYGLTESPIKLEISAESPGVERLRHARDLSQFLFFQKYNDYCVQSIEESLNSPIPFIRMLAILDYRTTKPHLKAVNIDLYHTPEWLTPFYELRLSLDH